MPSASIKYGVKNLCMLNEYKESKNIGQLFHMHLHCNLSFTFYAIQVKINASTEEQTIHTI